MLKLVIIRLSFSISFSWLKACSGDLLFSFFIKLKEERIVYIFVDKEKLDTIQENNQGIIASINPFEYGASL